MAVESVRFGVGTFKLGTAPGTDFSCQVQSMGLNVDKDEGDTITVLCGDQVPGSITYTYTLAGTVLQDIATASGLVEYTWTNAGEQVAFEFTPNTAGTTKVAGTVVIDPLSIGTSDGEFGDVLTSDFEWTCVGKPTVTWSVLTTLEAEEPAA
jgi:hypothetical protein